MTGRNNRDESIRFIWATRGKTWGFRFLRSAGFADPLTDYERAFADVSDQREVCHRADPDTVVLRFDDPESRCDSAGRVIPHDFVLIGRWADGINSITEGLHAVWPLVADEFAACWDAEEPPPARL